VKIVDVLKILLVLVKVFRYGQKALFGTGMTTACIQCLQIGLDPDGNETNYNEMMKHLDKDK
jgi:hypothetical protein